MKKVTNTFGISTYLILIVTLFACSETFAQFNRGGMGRGGMMGRQRSAIPQTQQAPEEPKPKTADEIVDGEMPRIAEAIGLNDFENAVVSSILKKYVQERIEAQILKLPPEKMSEVYQKINERQDAEIKAGLPADKYEAFNELKKEGVSKALKKKKKQKRKKPKN